ncbi:unnamed protein product [Rhizophagus irregularis]|nr:unnamed protein product [Rhizophagus irregularis]CAB4425969.1 unnamed protein product [Rhizophagus irregularis]
MSAKKRTILTAEQKRELCETKEQEPKISNVDLAQKYNIGKSTVTDILNEKERWLAISGDQRKIKKFRGPKWPQLESALSLWVDNALNTKQNIDGNIIKIKANFFANKFSIEDFHQSEGWLGGFKKRHGLRQYKKQRLFVQNRIEAYDNVQDGLVSELADYSIYDALQNSAEAWSMVSSQTISNCWKKTGILPLNNEDTFDDDLIFDDLNDEDEELEKLIALLPESDLNAQEYINIEDEMAEGGLTDDEIIDAILNANKEEEPIADGIDEIILVLEKVSPVEAKKAMDKIIRFLYEQEAEFGEVSDELKILKELQRRIKISVINNLKQVNIQDYFSNNV